MSDGPKPDDLAAKAEKLAADALEAGKKFIDSDTGKKVAEVTDSAFATAEEMGRKIADSEMGKKALESDLGKQAVEFAKAANEQTKSAIPNLMGRNVAIGAAAGAVVAIPIPFIGPLIGAVVGAGLGYLRTITKKP
ncbi:MAG: hypothetical protein ACOYLS_09960 [Polymorphobacter sp.]